MIKIFSNFFFYACVCLFLATFSEKTAAQRIGHSNQTWKMIITEHFEIFYSAQHQDLGLYYAKIAEESYHEITTVFTEKPTEKIVVIINDSTDISNGFTTLIPYPYIMIYPVQVGPRETLSESGEWAKELFIHELTHVFQLYPARGFYSWLKPIFGTIIAPNMLMPLWWKEGMAVQMETRFSHQGRLRSYYQDAVIRSFVLDDQLFKYTISEINEVLPTWPYGNRPYLFGSLIMQQLDKPTDNPEDVNQNINTLVTHQSERLPYFIEQPMKDLFGYGYESHYFQTIEKYNTHAQGQISSIKNISTTDETFKIIDDQLISSRHPRYNNRDQLLGMIVTEKNGKKLALYKLENSKQWKRLNLKQPPKNDISSFEFHPNRSLIVFAKTDNISSNEIFSDLYLYDYSQDKIIKITNAERARQPQWNGDGNSLFYISTANGRTQIKQMLIDHLDFNTDNDELKLSGEVLMETSLSQRYHEVIPLKQNQLLYTLVDETGDRKIYKYNLITKENHHLTSLKPQAENFKIIDQNLYYSSTATGVSNIYKYDLSLQTNIAQTNMITGVIDFDIDGSQGFGTVFTSKGPQVFNYSLSHFSKLPEITHQVRNKYNYQNNPRPDLSLQSQDAVAAKYLYPHYFIPFISTSSNDQSLYLQLMTSGHDPLMIHQYNLSIDYDAFIKKVGYNVNYVNSYYDSSITVQSYRRFKSFGLNTKALEKNQTAIAAIPDLFHISPDIQLMLGLLDQSTDDTYRPTHHTGIFTQILYKDISKTIFDIYPTKGISTLVRYENNRARDRNTTDNLSDYEQLTGSIQYYFSRWLPEDHTLSFKIDFLHTLQNVSSRFGTSNATSSLSSDSGLPEFLFRGYSLGQFYGSRMVTLNQEYRFPIKTLNRGNGTDPYYLKKLNGAFIVDGLAVKGSAYDKNQFVIAEDMHSSYWSYGAEARLETTIGYLLPVNFILGFYIPTAPRYSNSAQTALSLQIGGFNR